MQLRRAVVGAAALICGVLPFTASPASAGEVFAGAAAHDVNIGVARCCWESGADIQVGARTSPLAHILGKAELRAHILASLNTHKGTNFAALGLTARFPLAKGRFYIQPGLGGAIHDGPSEKYQKTLDRIYFGSRILFEPELSLGWKLSRHLAAEATYTHLSHAQLAGRQNPGVDNLGVRFVYNFDD